MDDITIAIKFNVIPPNSLLLPGCEPNSTVTSTKLYEEMLKAGTCKCAIVDVDKALEAIPGSYIIFLDNFGPPANKFYVLPSVIQNCPIAPHTDWYAILRSLCRAPTEEECEKINACSVLDQGFFHGTQYNQPTPY
jgi:hypothetical protein